MADQTAAARANFSRKCPVFRRGFKHSEKQVMLVSAQNVKAAVSAILF
jgi:hypothetical protein